MKTLIWNYLQEFMLKLRDDSYFYKESQKSFNKEEKEPHTMYETFNSALEWIINGNWEIKFTLRPSKVVENKVEVLSNARLKEINNSFGHKSNWNSDKNTVRARVLSQNASSLSKSKTISRNINNFSNRFSNRDSISNSSEGKMIKLIKIGSHSSSDSQKNTISNFGSRDKWAAQSMSSPLPLKLKDTSVNMHYRTQASVLKCKLNQ